MSYVALYRKWRPDNFDEVKGQDAIVRTLRNQILYDRIGHAYLFCGTRGTGKTSIAKLFARAVNCENPSDGNPCNVCPACQAIRSQSSLDVREIDAASNNGVDHVREIREEVQYTPSMGKYKVYIIDEVHMLSQGAFNALLKTLEEPPSYVIFILATTEKHKIPVTILSRCQQYDFRRISTETISAHLVDLMQKEQIEAEEKALRYIARAADGSMRDALSLLDQCISFYLGQTLLYENVLKILGAMDITVFSGLLRHVLSQDTSQVLKIIDDAVFQGRELSQFLSDFLWYLRNLLLYKAQNEAFDSIDLSADNIAVLKEDGEIVDTGTLLRLIRVLSDLSARMRSAAQKRILLEVGFIRLCLPQMDTDMDSLLERLRILEEKMASGAYQAGGNPSGTSAGISAAARSIPEESSSPVSGDPDAFEKHFPPADAADLKKIAAGWKDIVLATQMPMRSHLRAARPVVSDDSKLIRLLFEKEGLPKDYFEQDHGHNLELLSDITAEVTGKRVSFECITESQTRSAKTDYFDLSMIHTKIIYE